jgi:hypothetical protein
MAESAMVLGLMKPETWLVMRLWQSESSHAALFKGGKIVDLGILKAWFSVRQMDQRFGNGGRFLRWKANENVNRAFLWTPAMGHD